MFEMSHNRHTTFRVLEEPLNRRVNRYNYDQWQLDFDRIILRRRPNCDVRDVLLFAADVHRQQAPGGWFGILLLIRPKWLMVHQCRYNQRL